jgi:hypothetical protein
VAIDTHTTLIPGLQLYVQMTATSFDIMKQETVQVKLAPNPQPMTLSKNVAGSPAVCPSADPCWIYSTVGVINSPLLPGTFLQPETITVTSNMGATYTVPATSIILR